MNDREILIEFMKDEFKGLKDEVRQINTKMNNFVTGETCRERSKKVEDNCISALKLKTKELSISKISAIGAIITGVIGGSSLIVVTVIKIFLQ